MDKITISLDDISVRYNNGHTALYDVSLHLQGGTTCALVGINGSGKSTLFKVLMGLIKPQTGHVKLCDLPIAQALKKIWSPMCHKAKKLIGNFLYQF